MRSESNRAAPLLQNVGLVLLALALGGGMLANTRAVEAYHDWDQHVFYAEAAARAVLAHHELPLWNPFPCGGTPLLAHPESRVLTPFFLLHLVLAPAVALRWEILLHFLIAALGSALLVSRHVTGEPLARAAAALIAATIFAGSTFFALHLAEGHMWILSAAYAPLVVALYERGLERLSRAALAGAVLALVMGEGGIYPAPHLALLLGVYALVLAAATRTWRPLLALAVAGLSCVLLSAPKLLPLLELLSRHPRHVDSLEWLPARALVQALLGRSQALDRPFDWVYWPWHEQGHYVGLFALLLAAMGGWAGGWRARAFGVPLLVFLALGAGHFADWAPWAVLHEVPPFRSQHVPSRFLFVAVLAIAVLASAGAAAVLARLQGARMRAALAGLLVAVTAVDVLTARAGILSGTPRCPMGNLPPGPAPTSSLLTLRRPRGGYCGAQAYSAMAPAARAGVALIDAYEPMCPRHGGLVGRDPGLIGADEPGYPGEAWREDGAGSAAIVSRSLNTLELLVTGESGLVVLNQNWDPGWRSDEGKVVDSRGRLALAVPARDQPAHYRLRYVPPLFGLGSALALVGAAGLAALLWRERRRSAT